MTIIDIDAHFSEPFDWLETTDPELAAMIPAADYPHNEGGADALATFKAQLDGRVDDTTQAAFFGGTIAADLALSA